jgi:chromosome segregation ATPase
VTQTNESSDRLDRIEALMAQTIAENRAASQETNRQIQATNQQIQETNQQLQETNQQVREVSTQIRAMANFHDRFEQELSVTKQLIESNAKAIEANGSRDIKRAKYELESIRELSRSIRYSHAESLDNNNNALRDSIEDIRDDIREINRKLDRPNTEE